MTTENFGWTGKHIRVNLTASTITVCENDQRIMTQYLGARGVGAKYMWDEVDPKTDALEPNNKLIVATGPLTCMPPAGNRTYFVTKSPLTGGIANAGVGGYFGAELKFSGFDFIIFEGRAKSPVYLWINDGKMELRPADHIWGKGTEDSEEILLAETDPMAHIAAIGPAGENMVRLANVITGGVTGARAAGRGGVGAVMGSKHLKAVVVRGTGGVKIADLKTFNKNISKIWKYWEDPSPSCAQGLGQHGTIGVLSFTNNLGILPTRNFRTGVFEGAHKISGETFAEKYSARGARPSKACFGCPAGCARLSVVNEPGYEGKGEGPEYESVASLGSVTGVDHLPAVIKAGRICNDMGMDTISAGVTVGCAMELYEIGALPEKDIGYPLHFGDHEALLDLVQKMATRDGFGWIMGEGSYRLGERYGHPELSMSVKKQELPNYDPRGVKGQGLAFVTNNRGGDHCRAEVNCSEIYETTMLGYWSPEKDVDAHAIEGKVEMTIHYQDYSAWAYDSLGFCYFLLMDTPEQDVVDLLESATGIKFGGVDELNKQGERIFTLERLFNLRAGLSAKDDTLPKRFLTEPMPDGPSKGQVFEQDQLLPDYYRMRGWDKNGIPQKEKIDELDLS
ncbi:aldehyde ferredoxin oxidoreductase family protein [Desulforhopalus singaporensis]|uniref:Aldehyde:ferredoxin oxidoreductase n=1 Tax=Desulforhopalus singaporensis TaxID=91360 RepID=A0A1H0V8I7_9BACT|nr:aldehyde ferredoxin oxidoreductase family protein [Desulforhopalus singaporensis]SDP74717.1 aldehyde:ferredoxin oxidoreductase [Desulforhopalus singaporensis]